MGVPGFLKWIKNTCRNCIQENISTTKGILAQVLIDLNSFIHQAAAEIYGYDGHEGVKNPSHKLIIERVIDKVKHILDTYNAEEYFISIDGVPTLSKISQQKKRRFNAIQIKDWNNIFISPYHPFMAKLYEKLYLEFDQVNYARRILNDDGEIISKKFSIDRLGRYKKISEKDKEKLMNEFKKVIISSHYESGEGEHKIMANMKKSGKIAIFGTDADIVILSLAKSNNDIYISSKYGFIYKKKFSEYLASSGMINTDDFILITYLFGNDFIPRLEDFENIRTLTKAIEIYKNFMGIIYKDTPINELTTRKEINWVNLKRYFLELLKYSNYFYSSRTDADYLSSIYIKEGKPQFLKLVHMSILDQKRRQIYYPYQGDHINIIKEDMCTNWLIGLQWFNETYQGKIYSDWYYHFNHPLMLEEIVDFMDHFLAKNCFKENIKIIENQAKKNEYRLSLLQHFIAICPHKYLDLIKDVNLTSLEDYFPIEYKDEMMATIPIIRIMEI